MYTVLYKKRGISEKYLSESHNENRLIMASPQQKDIGDPAFQACYEKIQGYVMNMYYKKNTVTVRKSSRVSMNTKKKILKKL